MGSPENNERSQEVQQSKELTHEDLQKLRDKAFRKKVAENAKTKAENTGDSDFDKKMKELRAQQMQAALEGGLGEKSDGSGQKNSGEVKTEVAQNDQVFEGGSQKNSGQNENQQNGPSEKSNEARKMITEMLYGENPKIIAELIKNGQITKEDYVAVASAKLQSDRGWSAGKARINASTAYDTMKK